MGGVLTRATSPRRPQIDAYAGSLSTRRVNHALGAIRSNGLDRGAVHGSRLIVHTVHLGQGRACWRRARRLLLEWRMHEGSAWSAVHTHPNGALVTLAAMPHPRLPLFWVLNPCRVVHSRGGLFTGQASVGYATLDGHLIAGEERMSVRRGPSGDVTFHLLSLSRGAGPAGKLLFLALGRTQDRFFREQCRCMRVMAATDGRVQDAQTARAGRESPCRPAEVESHSAPRPQKRRQ